MQRMIAASLLAACAGWLAFGQSPEAQQKFEIADVHVSAKNAGESYSTGPIQNGRYEMKHATMVDLIRAAYGFSSDKIFGGPGWLELDRFDMIAKVPADIAPDTRKEMFQALLAERFKLVVHMDTKPVPALALSAGKKPLLKEAAGTEPAGCKVNSDSGGGAAEGGPIITMTRFSSIGAAAAPVTIKLGPGGTVQYQCRNVTIEAFADELHTMYGTNLMSAGSILDDTGLKGRWNFDIRYSMSGPPASAGDRISIYDAIDKQLGLKLEEKPVATPVIVVDSVNRMPSANPPGAAEAFPTIPAPTEFEVASIKPADPEARSGRSWLQVDRLDFQNMPLRYLVNLAFDTNNNEYVVGLPKFADSDRYNVLAKPPKPGPGTRIDEDAMKGMIRALLADRCKMTHHTEDRTVSAYSLVAAKPKLKKADPESRTSCKTSNSPLGAPPGTRVVTCQNATMAQLAERLQGAAPELGWPIADATGIEGGWDFTLTYTRNNGMAVRVGGPAPGQGGDAVPSASEPVASNTVFEALEKQLGLKLEKQKRTMPVIVIDRFEKPSEN